MSTQPTEEPLRLVVAFNPVPSASRVAHHHATRFRLAVQAFIVVVIGGLLWALTADAFQLSTVMWMLGAWVVLFLVLFVIQNLRLHAARKDLLDVGRGPRSSSVRVACSCDEHCAASLKGLWRRLWTRFTGMIYLRSRWGLVDWVWSRSGCLCR